MYYTIRAFFNGEIEELSDEFFFENKKEYLYTRPDKESLNSFLYTISSEIRRQRYYYCHPDDLFLLCTPAYNIYRRNHGASAQQLLLFFLLYNWIMIQASSSHENLSSRELESFFETGVYPLLLLSFALVDIWKPYGTSVHTHNAQREGDGGMFRRWQLLLGVLYLSLLFIWHIRVYLSMTDAIMNCHNVEGELS